MYLFDPPREDATVPEEIAVEKPVEDEEEQHEESPRGPPERSPVQLYTESDIGSPSAVSDTPEKPVRKGSFSFASLPAREPLKHSLGPQATEIVPTRQQSLGLDSDDGDDESIDLRAPELIAHEERMKAYESPAQPTPRAYESPIPPTPPVPVAIETPATELPPQTIRNHTSTQDDEQDMPGMYPSIEKLEEPLPESPSTTRRTRSSTKRTAEEIEEPEAADSKKLKETVEEEQAKQEEPTHAAPRPSVRRITSNKETSRLRAPKGLGRPVRPTNTAAAAKGKQPQPVAIKIKPLSHPKPMNTAPVAAHNQENSRPEPSRPELKTKTSAQSINNTFNKSTTKAPAPPPKVLSLAQKKKQRDEEAAARDAAVKQQQKERRDAKIEELRRQKRDEEAELDRKARQNSAEKQQDHLQELEKVKARQRKSEERQEREEAAAAAKKAAFREMQEKRQIRPATKPAIARPQNPPPRPPARLDLHEDMRAEEETPPRLGAPLRQLSLQRQQPDAELPAYPSNLSKPPVRVSNLQGKKPSIFTTTQPGASALQNFPQPPRGPQQAPQMQHFATQKIPFATTPMQTLQQHHQQSRAPMSQVPGNNAPFAPMHNMQIVNDTSPMSLPEIHTDSSDNSDQNVELPSWATPGHVFNTLSQQETLNPDAIFPRIQAISMDDVFAENPDRLRRLRMRTSSANWVRTGDALNQVEVIEDRIGRQNIRNAGGWVYDIRE